MPRWLLLVCGILSSLLYVAMNVFIPMRWPDYSSAAQTISELSAIDAPTRSVWVPFGIAYAALLMAFGRGVSLAARHNRALRAIGGLLIAFGLLSLFWPPMHLRGTQFTLTDTMHIAFASVTVLLMVLLMGFGAAAFGKRFRIYSLASLAVLIACGAMTGRDAPRIAANLPTPWVGLWERINVGVFLLWVIALAIALMKSADRRFAEARG